MRERLGSIKRSPLAIIELVIAGWTIVGGLYLLTPLLQYSIAMNGKSELVQTLGSNLAIDLFGGFFLLSGIIMLLGVLLNNRRFRRTGLLLNACGRMYALLGVFIITGFFPLTWINGAVVLGIVVVLWFVHGEKLRD